MGVPRRWTCHRKRQFEKNTGGGPDQNPPQVCEGGRVEKENGVSNIMPVYGESIHFKHTGRGLGNEFARDCGIQYVGEEDIRKNKPVPGANDVVGGNALCKTETSTGHLVLPED